MMIASLIRWGSWALFQELLADCVPDCVSDCILIASLIRWGSWALFQELLGELKLVADRHGTTIANVAVCWVLRQLGPLVCMQVLITAPSPLPTGAAAVGASGRLGGAWSTRYDSSGEPRRAPLIA